MDAAQPRGKAVSCDFVRRGIYTADCETGRECGLAPERVLIGGRPVYYYLRVQGDGNGGVNIFEMEINESRAGNDFICSVKREGGLGMRGFKASIVGYGQ